MVVIYPLNHYASKIVVTAQDNLMKARDERISIMNEAGSVFSTAFTFLTDWATPDIRRDSDAKGILFRIRFVLVLKYNIL